MCPKMYWKSEDVRKIKAFVQSQAKVLVPVFYHNILLGEIKIRKPKGFFKQMGEFLGRSGRQCKSKFQKLEERIYVEFLKVPEEDFSVFCWIRKGQSKAGKDKQSTEDSSENEFLVAENETKDQIAKTSELLERNYRAILVLPAGYQKKETTAAGVDEGKERSAEEVETKEDFEKRRIEILKRIQRALQSRSANSSPGKLFFSF